MTNVSIHRIRQSYRLLVPRMDGMTANFYDRLFAAIPEARELFKAGLGMQRQHFAAALAMIVRNLPMLDLLDEPLRELGAEHAQAGVRPEHYPPVCDALLAAIAQTLGDSWDNELSADWHGLLEAVAARMLAGSRD